MNTHGMQLTFRCMSWVLGLTWIDANLQMNVTTLYAQINLSKVNDLKLSTWCSTSHDRRSTWDFLHFSPFLFLSQVYFIEIDRSDQKNRYTSYTCWTNRLWTVSIQQSLYYTFYQMFRIRCQKWKFASHLHILERFEILVAIFVHKSLCSSKCNYIDYLLRLTLTVLKVLNLR